MTIPGNHEATQPSEPTPFLPEWSSEAVGKLVVGRTVHVPRWVVSENQLHDPFVQTTLHRVVSADISEGGMITFEMLKLEADKATHDSDERRSVVFRSGKPDEVMRTEDHEIWVYGDQSDPHNDQILIFNL